MIDREVLERLAKESGRRLAELGVRPTDEGWIRQQAISIASLERAARLPRGLAGLLYRLARRAARTAR